MEAFHQQSERVRNAPNLEAAISALCRRHEFERAAKSAEVPSGPSVPVRSFRRRRFDGKEIVTNFFLGIVRHRS